MSNEPFQVVKKASTEALSYYYHWSAHAERARLMRQAVPPPWTRARMGKGPDRTAWGG
jgi:hypothetical protein